MTDINIMLFFFLSIYVGKVSTSTFCPLLPGCLEIPLSAVFVVVEPVIDHVTVGPRPAAAAASVCG